MPRFEIIEGKPQHCGAMVRRLRLEHRSAIARLGVNTHRELRRAFDDSSYRRALMIDGVLGALGGVTGAAMGSRGSIWFAVTQDATRYPHQVCRVCRNALEEIFEVKRELHTFILPADETSFRFAKMLGFQTLRNSPIEAAEGKVVPMVIRREPKISYSAAEQAVFH